MGDFLDRIAERFGGASSLQRVKFGRGVVGKLAGVAIVFLFAVAYMSRYLPSGQVFPAIILAALVGLLIVGSILLIAFKRPELAVMEGMELVNYRRLIQASKDFVPGMELPPIPEPPPKEPNKEGESK